MRPGRARAVRCAIISCALAAAALSGRTAHAQSEAIDTGAPADSVVAAPYNRFVASTTGTMAIEADPRTQGIGMVGVRLTYRFQPDFSFWAEGTLGVGGPSALICAPPLHECPGGKFGDRMIRAWHVGMETRLAGYNAANPKRLMFGAGVGRMSVKHRDMEEYLDRLSLQTAVAYEFPIAEEIGGRVATVAFFSSHGNAEKAINGVWEAVGLQLGLTFGI